MKMYDLHQDLMTHIRFRDRLQQSHQTSFADIETSAIDLVVATAFPFPENDDQGDSSVTQLITEELMLYRDWLAEHATWQLVLETSDLDSAAQKILLHIEGLNVFTGRDSDWEQLQRWIDLGVRSIGTHWNIENSLGGGTLQPDAPLTTLGGEVVSFLEEKHLIFDMAHMGRRSFFDAAALTTRPLYVSHGNADAVCANVRNYTDEQLRLIADRDGVLGVFFAQTFTTGKNQLAAVDNVMAHINYLRDLIGVRHIAIGSDWGGIVSGGVTGLEHVHDVTNLVSALRAAQYSEADIEAIMWRNADRVLRAHLG